MRAVWSIGSKTKCFLDAVPSFVRVGYIQSAEIGTHPLIDIGYTLDELMTLSKLTGTMVREKRTPKVYFWNERAHDPEVLISFEIENPSIPLLRSILGTGVLTAEIMKGGCHHLLALGAANTTKPNLQKFSEIYRQKQRAVLILSDASSIHTADTSIDPVQTFYIDDITFGQPSMSLF